MAAKTKATEQPPMTGNIGLDLDWVFDYHTPNEHQTGQYDTIRAGAKAFAKVIMETCPSCADRSAAIRKVREAMMTADSAVALSGTV